MRRVHFVAGFVSTTSYRPSHVTQLLFDRKNLSQEELEVATRLARPGLGLVVHFHGNGGNITSQWGFSCWLADYGFNVFVLDYRGYVASEGTPSARGAKAQSKSAPALRVDPVWAS